MYEHPNVAYHNAAREMQTGWYTFFMDITSIKDMKMTKVDYFKKKLYCN